MFSQIIKFATIQDFTSELIDYTLLSIAFFTFFILVNNIIKAIKLKEANKSLVKVKI